MFAANTEALIFKLHKNYKLLKLFLCKSICRLCFEELWKTDFEKEKLLNVFDGGKMRGQYFSVSIGGEHWQGRCRFIAHATKKRIGDEKKNEKTRSRVFHTTITGASSASTTSSRLFKNHK